jgi:hypothetical protein
MRKIVKHGAVALALLGSVALLTGPVVANSLHDEGDFGGGYRIIGPSGGPERYAYVRHHTSAHIIMARLTPTITPRAGTTTTIAMGLRLAFGGRDLAW